MYLKMIFVNNLEQITKHLWFKFDTVPTKSAETCLFSESGLESSWMQPVGELYLKCDLIFYKNGVVPFWNVFLVHASQKFAFLTLRKWKMTFSCYKVENFLRQHCLPRKDVYVRTVWAQSDKIFHECGHNIGHLAWKPWNLVCDSSVWEHFLKIFAIF